MLDSDNVKKMEETIRTLTASNVALMRLLVSKGVATDQEIYDEMMKATADIDQEIAKTREEYMATMSPEDRLMFEEYLKSEGE